MLKKISAFLLLSTTYFLLSTKIMALELQSPLYRLQTEEQTNINNQVITQMNFSIESIYGAKAYKDFKTIGFFITDSGQDKPIKSSISNNLISLGDVSKSINLLGKTDLSALSQSELDYQISLIEDYRLKNSAGDTLSDLKYRLGNDGNWQVLANQNSGMPPKVILYGIGNKEQNQTINFSLTNQPNQQEGTYESIIEFILSSSY